MLLFITLLHRLILKIRIKINVNVANIGEKQRLLNEYQSADTEKKSQMEKLYGKKQLQRLMENIMSENWINDNSHNCPHCKTAIEVGI